jgi:hypothetical protein
VCLGAVVVFRLAIWRLRIAPWCVRGCPGPPATQVAPDGRPDTSSGSLRSTLRMIW